MTRYLIALILVATTLTGCGFHLRNRLTLPADMPSVKVESQTRYSELVKLINRGLRASGVTVVGEDGTPGRGKDDPGLARLQIRSERWGDLPIAIDSQGRAQEYSLRYAVVFSFLKPDGSVLVPEQAVELSRDYVSPPEDATGTTTEREILADELRREMSASILRRIDSVIRADMEKQKNALPVVEGAKGEGDAG
ncbi:lipoprotein [Stenotrophomonas humi]|uniref:LPS-assembly lipoprotein LptE n=1 Tax=Stenotrophomonas humi TaxID=405444 RepID=A0A0R0C681_9GAMM|nr:lipoprotein [Stenotrophomonas humi]